jgi:hypothetical protein
MPKRQEIAEQFLSEWFQPEDTFGLRNLGYAAQVSLNLPVWDWFATHARVRQEHAIQKDCFEVVVDSHDQPVSSVTGKRHKMSFALQTITQESGHLRFVFDDQHTHAKDSIHP